MDRYNARMPRRFQFSLKTLMLAALSVRNFFLEKGTPSVISQLSTPGDYKVCLPGPTKDQFAQLIKGANVELIPPARTKQAGRHESSVVSQF